MVESPNYYFGPPSFHDQQTNHYYLSMLYCGFFIVATAGLILAIYHCLALNWCSEYPPAWPRHAEAASTDQRFHVRKVVDFDSIVFKFEKGQEEEEEDECVVCLSGFEEGEDVRKLVRCKHAFHAPCIDMWLHSHFDCPLCRAPVGDAVARSENSDSAFHGSVNPV